MSNFFVFFGLHRIGFLEYFYPKLGEDFNPSVVPLYQNMDQVPSPGEEFIDILCAVQGVQYTCQLFLRCKREIFILAVPGILNTTRSFPKIPNEFRSLPKTSEDFRSLPKS